MLNAPPDPVASLEAEQRSEDDGMPEHPHKSADPVGWADAHVEREKAVAAGYPTTKVGQAWADVLHSAARLIDRAIPSGRVTISTTSAVASIGAGVAIYLLLKRNRRYRFQ